MFCLEIIIRYAQQMGQNKNKIAVCKIRIYSIRSLLFFLLLLQHSDFENRQQRRRLQKKTISETQCSFAISFDRPWLFDVSFQSHFSCGYFIFIGMKICNTCKQSSLVIDFSTVLFYSILFVHIQFDRETYV